MTEQVEHKFNSGDKAIAKVRILDTTSYAPVEIVNLLGFENFSGVLFPKYYVKSLDSWSYHTLFETDLYTKEGLMEVLDLYLK